MAENLEGQLIELIATDRTYIPISSMDGKLKRQRTKLAKGIDLSGLRGKYSGERVYARTETEDRMKARGMSEGIEAFCEAYPRQGEILRGLIAEQRVQSETHLYFGVNEGSRLSADDYMGVMLDLGFTEATAKRLYPKLMDISRNLSKKRDEERSVLIGGSE